MSKAMRAMVVALVLGVMGLVGCVPVYAAEDATPAGGWVLAATGAPVVVPDAPCESEDQEYGPCLWDARSMGNGSGESFIVEEDGSVSYLRWRDGREIAFPGWLWVGTVDPATTAGLPACADVHGEVTCERDGRYVLAIDSRACTQTITTVAGERYIPGPAVAKALSDQCDRKTTSSHQDQAGLHGARSSVSMGVVHSAAPSAVVDKPVAKATFPSRDTVVGPVDSGVKGNYDLEVVVVFGALTLLGLAGGVWWQRRRDGRRVGCRGCR
jgi:lipoprotein|nr:MAG TPA: hypothetical protein [Caudoviricetes sp.]